MTRTASVRATRANRLPLYAMLAANAISMVGNEFSYIAIPWFVLQTTGSAAQTGLVAATGVIPLILSSFFSGALVDRLGYKRVTVVSEVASGVNVALIPLLYLTVGLPFWLLLLLVFLGAVLDAPGYSARQSLLPELAELAGMPLERANSIWMIAGRSASLLGAPLAGLMIVWLGTSNVLWLDAASFAISAAIIALVIPSPAKGLEPEAERRSYLDEVGEGLRFIRRDRLIFWMVATMSLGSLLAEPLYPVILPVYADEVFGSAFDLGLMFAALGGGSIIGAALYAWFGHRLPRRPLYIIGFLGRALTFWVFVFIPPLWVMVAAIVVNAIMLEPVNPLSMTILQERVPAGMRGRIFGAMLALGMASRPVGMIAYGFLLSSIGLQSTLVILAAVNLALPVALLFVPALHQMNAPATRTERTTAPA